MSIASRITAIEGHIADDYNALEYIGADLTNVDKNIENIKNVLADIYNDMPKVSESDVESASLSPTRKGAMSIKYKGETQQDSTPTPSSPQEIHNVSGDNTIEICGKNIANLIRSAGTYTGNGTQFSNSQYFVNMARDSGVGSSVTLTSATNDTIVVKGRYNQGIGFPRKCKPNTYYSLQATSTSADARVYMSFFDNTGTFISGSANDTNMTRTLQAPNNAYWVIPIFAVVGSTLTDTTFTNIMLEESNTINTYEPYTGNSQLISLGVENLFDKDNANIINGYIQGSTGKIISDVDAIIYISCKPNTTYTIQKMVQETASNNAFRIGTSQSTPALGTILDNFVYSSAIDKYSQYTYTTNGTANYLVIYCYKSNNEKTQSEMLATIQIEKGSKANSYNPYGASYIELNKINTYQDKILKGTGKNLLDYSTCVIGDLTQYGVEQSSTIRIRSNYIEITPTTNYVCSLTGGQYTAFFYDSNNNYVSGGESWIDSGTSFTTPNNVKYLRLKFKNTAGTTISLSDLTNVMLEKGSTSSEYEPYGFKDKWYLHKEIGKVVLDGSASSWQVNSAFTTEYMATKAEIGINLPQNSPNFISTHFIPQEYAPTLLGYMRMGGTYVCLNYDGGVGGIDNFKTWLQNNNVEVYYVLASSTDTEITDTTLLEQLETIKRSYEGVTNISQENNDLPFILDVSALKEWE